MNSADELAGDKVEGGSSSNADNFDSKTAAEGKKDEKKEEKKEEKPKEEPKKDEKKPEDKKEEKKEEKKESAAQVDGE